MLTRIGTVYGFTNGPSRVTVGGLYGSSATGFLLRQDRLTPARLYPQIPLTGYAETEQRHELRERSFLPGCAPACKGSTARRRASAVAGRVPSASPADAKLWSGPRPRDPASPLATESLD